MMACTTSAIAEAATASPTARNGTMRPTFAAANEHAKAIEKVTCAP